MCHGVDSASENEYQETPGGKDGRCEKVSKVEKIRSLNYRIPKGLLRHVAGKLYLFTLKQDIRFLKTRVKAGYPLQRNRQRFSPV